MQDFLENRSSRTIDLKQFCQLRDLFKVETKTKQDLSLKCRLQWKSPSPKQILGPKKLCVQKNVGPQKILGLKTFWFKEIVGPKHFWA